VTEEEDVGLEEGEVEIVEVEAALEGDEVVVLEEETVEVVEVRFRKKVDNSIISHIV